MPTCGTYSAPATPQITADNTQMNSLKPSGCTTAEHQPRFGVANGGEDAAEFGAVSFQPPYSASTSSSTVSKTARRGWPGRHRKAQNALEVGKAVIAAKAGFVAKNSNMAAKVSAWVMIEKYTP